MPWYTRWRHVAQRLRQDSLTLWLAARHPRTPWTARLLAGVLVAYAFSPIDLIPDFIPVLGLLDELVLLPVGILVVRRLIPETVLAECRSEAAALADRPVSWGGAALIVVIWLVLAAASVWWLVWR